jgi:hypothetical protein
MGASNNPKRCKTGRGDGSSSRFLRFIRGQKKPLKRGTIRELEVTINPTRLEIEDVGEAGSFHQSGGANLIRVKSP